MASSRRPSRLGSGADAPLRVLIVDDQSVFRRAARQLLEARGYVVVAEADCAAAALEAVERFEPDAILLDIRLGDESGYEIARALTRLDPTVKVLLVSITDDGDGDEQARACGARGFLPKAWLAVSDLGRYWPAPRGDG